ncbi:MAG: RraA family protein, partial [Firmicutes bacterium]|nr:RraA family protein [Bacillota bacterium]
MWTEELKERFMKTDPAAYGHFIGVRFMAPKIKPINPNSKICGPAYTVKTYGKDHYAMFKAIEDAPAGSVIVIDRAGDEIYAPVGEFVARGARAKGLAGFVIDGMATDSAYIRTFEDFPVFCSGLSAVTCNCWGITGETQIDVCCGGWMAHHNTDLWRIAGPVDGAFWGMYPNGGAWLATHLWTHYLFSKDEAFLREWYPVIKGTADFYLDYLQTDPRNGYLVVVPSVSPEHGPMGKKSPITAGCTMDTQIVRDALTSTLQASEILGLDEADYRAA